MDTPIKIPRKNTLRETRFDRGVNLVVHFLCILVLIIVIYPLYFIVIASFSDSDLVNQGKVLFYPKGFSLYGYQKVWEDHRIWTGYKNTLIYSIGGTIINMVATTTAAYALSRKEFAARRFINGAFVFTMFFNGGMVPTYMLISSLGLVNNRLVMMIPFCVNVFNLIILRTSFEALPNDLYEAATLDGSSHVGYFLRIALPLVRATLSVVTLYYFVAHWNDFFNALLYLNKPGLAPLQMILRDILLSNQVFTQGSSAGTGNSYAQRYADQVKYVVIIVSTVPLIVIYPFVQKYFEKGVMIGAIKG